MPDSTWMLNQQNLITFVMVDNAGTVVVGLGGGFTLQVSKAGGAFAGSAGAKAEIGSGWYSYLATAGEADTVGPVSITVTGVGAVQQNLEYVIRERTAGGIEFTYTVTNAGTGAPIDGVEVWFCTDAAGANVVWHGVTDALGVARDNADILPWLDAGTYYIFCQKAGFTFSNPDTEVVS